MDAKDFTSPGKVAAFLSNYNAWRRDQSGIDEAPEAKMPSPRDIGMALDAAVQMLEASDIHSQALHYIAWEASSYVEAVQHAKEAIADTGAIPTPPCSGHAKQQEADHSEDALELVGLLDCHIKPDAKLPVLNTCTYVLRMSDPGCTGCAVRGEDQPSLGSRGLKP